jgi:hypothetical protein
MKISMGLLFNILTYLLFITLFLKVVLHMYLDNKSGKKIKVSSASKWVYFLPYYEDVAGNYSSVKSICNKLQRLSIFLLVICILVLIFKSFF